MIYLVISLLVSLIFIILGIRQYRAEKPVAINTGEKPPREDELTSVTEWMNITVRQSRQSGVARATCPD